jgi:uncharacterized protein (TIGR03118 family)
MTNLRKGAWRLGAALGLALAASSFALAADGYNSHVLVSDGTVPADHIDPALKNPWGITESSKSGFWIANNASNSTTIYDTNGVKNEGLGTIAIHSGQPTGAVFNDEAAGEHFGSDIFIFATQTGDITGWRGGANADDVHHHERASYTGLAIGNDQHGNQLLFAAQFETDDANSGVQVFDSQYNAIGTFNDPNAPENVAPFNVQVLNNQLYVTYAMTDGHDEIEGKGFGFVDVFNMDGTFNHRLITGGDLDDAWGLAMAPKDFGKFSGDLLVGNHGDGKIHAYNPVTGVELGTLTDALGNDIVINDLWALQFGNGALGGLQNSLYFTAGVGDEAHGEFGRIQSVPEPAPFLGLGLGTIAMIRRRGKKTR